MKTFTAITAFAAVLTLIAGCNGNSSTATGDQVRSAPAPGSPNASLDRIKNNPNMSPEAKAAAMRTVNSRLHGAQSAQSNAPHQ